MHARFDAFLKALELTPWQHAEGMRHQWTVRSRLNSHYYPGSDEIGNSLLIGAWGKGTAIRPPRAIDVAFSLPDPLRQRYDSLDPKSRAYVALRDVRAVLEPMFAAASIQGESATISVPLDSFVVRVIPGFQRADGDFRVFDATEADGYRDIFPMVEKELLESSDARTLGKTRDLIRMMRRWQEFREVPLRSTWIEVLCIEFLASWPHAELEDPSYGHMVRDFLEFMIGQADRSVPTVRSESIAIGAQWMGSVIRGLKHAVHACKHDDEGTRVDAGWEWQQLFGFEMPVMVLQ